MTFGRLPRGRLPGGSGRLPGGSGRLPGGDGRLGLLAGGGGRAEVFDLDSDFFGGGTIAGLDYTDLDPTKLWGPDQVGLFWQSQAITPVSASGQTVGVALNKERQLAGISNWTAHNLLLRSEDLTNAAWNKSTVTLTTGQADPSGGTAAFKIEATGADSNANQAYAGHVVGVSYCFSVWLRADTPTTIRIYGDGAAFTTCNVTTDWQQFTNVYVASGGTSQSYIGAGSSFSTGEIVYAWHPQLNRGTVPTTFIGTTTLSGFQAANAALQPTSGSRPAYTVDGARRYFLADGSDDGWVGPAMMPGPEMTLIASIVGNALSAGTDIVLGCAAAGPTGRCQLGIVDGVPAGGWGAHSISTITGGADIRGLNRTLMLRANGSVVELWDMAADGTRTRLYQAAPSGTATTANALGVLANNAAGTLGSFFHGQLGAALVAEQFLPDAKIRGAMEYCADRAFPS